MSPFFDLIVRPGLYVCNLLAGKRLARLTSYRGVPCVVLRNRRMRKLLLGDYCGAYLCGTMLFRSESDFRSRNTKRHEHRHYQQECKDFLFPPKYVFYTVMDGYWDNPYERDARRFASSSRRRRCLA